MAFLPVCFSFFAFAVQQSERSSELALWKGVMSIQRGCFRQVFALIRNGSLLDMHMGLGLVK